MAEGETSPETRQASQYDKVTLQMQRLLDDSRLSLNGTTTSSSRQSRRRCRAPSRQERVHEYRAGRHPTANEIKTCSLRRCLRCSVGPTIRLILLSFASSRRLTICMRDLAHGYFQGETLSKPLTLRQPKGGLPDQEIKPHDRMLCLVLIHRTRDAGRGLWREIKRVLLELGVCRKLHP